MNQSEPDWLYIDEDSIDFQRYGDPKSSVRSPLYFREELREYFLDNPNDKGAFLPWGGTHQLRFRKGEVSCWAGQNFSGKSAILTQSLLYWLRDTKYSDTKQKILLISPEFSPTINLARMAQQVLALPAGKIREPDVNAVLAWLEGKFYVFDGIGSIDVEEISAVIRYCTEELGVTMAIIDNLTVLRLKGTDTNRAQADLMTELVQTARTTGTHIHLVCHTRKPEKGEGQVSRYSIRGASQLSDLADNVLYVERNENKERKLLDLSLSDVERQEIKGRPDTRLHVLKQRHGTAWVGVERLWFSIYSMRWSDHPRSNDLCFEEVQQLEQIGGNAHAYQKY